MASLSYRIVLGLSLKRGILPCRPHSLTVLGLTFNSRAISSAVSNFLLIIEPYKNFNSSPLISGAYSLTGCAYLRILAQKWLFAAKLARIVSAEKSRVSLKRIVATGRIRYCRGSFFCVEGRQLSCRLSWPPCRVCQN